MRTLSAALVVRLVMTAPAILVTGCFFGSGNEGDVRGSVMLDGEPLVLGSITLEPTPGSSGEVTGGLVREGRYELTGQSAPKVGSYRVSIVASPTPTGRMVEDETKPPGTLSPEMIGGVVAPRFNTESTLHIEVVAGDNVANFDVTSE